MDHATVLIVRSVPSTDSYTVSNAMNAVRVTSSTREVPCLLRPDPVYCLPYRIVPTGYVGLHTHGGKFKGLWEPGRHVTTSPFDQIEYLIPKQAIVWEAPVKSCPTADNVMVEIDVTLVLKLDHSPESIQRFVYNLGPARLNQLLTAIQEEAIRGMARKKLYSEIYDLMDTVVDEQLENTKRSMNEQLGLYGVTVLSLTIINVHLPPHIAKNMEVETTYSSLNRFEQVKQSYNLLLLENREKIQKMSQGFEEELLKEASLADKIRSEAQRELDQIQAETSKILAEIKEKEMSDIRQVKSTSELIVAKLHAEKKIELAKIESDGHALANKIRLEAKAEIENKIAKTDAIVKANEAQAQEILAKAEELAAKMLKSKRDFDESMTQLDVLGALSTNSSCTVSGNNGDNVVAQLLAAQSSGKVVGLSVTP